MLILSSLLILFFNFSSVFTVGFKNEAVYVDDDLGIFDLELPVAITNGRTELPINLHFTAGNGTTASVGEGMWYHYF